MSNTRETLEQIRDLLKEEPPDIYRALRLVKDLLIQGLCARDTDMPRQAGIVLLDRLVRPILAGDQAHQARIGRLIRHLRTEHTFDSESIAAHLEAIAPGIAGKKAQVCSTDAPPSFPPELLRAALMTLGGHELKEIFPPGKGCDWASLHLQLGSIINRERRLRTNWQREQQDLQVRLAETTQALAETLRLVGVETGEEDRLADQLSGEAPLADFVTVRERLSEAVQKFRDRAQEIRGRLRDGQNAEERFRVLLRRAEWALQDTRDEKLLDAFTHLPNRFGLLAYLERTMQLHQRDGRGFSLMFILLDEYADIVEDLGRHRANQLMGSLAGRVTSEVRPGDYLARFNDETLALLCPGTTVEEAVALATHVRNVLDYTRFELQDAELSVRVCLGVVRHEAGEGTESLLGLASLAIKKAVEEEGSRIYSVPSRQPVEPPPSSPPPRKKRFGF